MRDFLEFQENVSNIPFPRSSQHKFFIDLKYSVTPSRAIFQYITFLSVPGKRSSLVQVGLLCREGSGCDLSKFLKALEVLCGVLHVASSAQRTISGSHQERRQSFCLRMFYTIEDGKAWCLFLISWSKFMGFAIHAPLARFALVLRQRTRAMKTSNGFLELGMFRSPFVLEVCT